MNDESEGARKCRMKLLFNTLPLHWQGSRQAVFLLVPVQTGNKLCWRYAVLRYSAERVLVYLYRPARLEKDLSNKEALDLLKKAGYRHENTNQCVVELIHRLNDLESEFPHEIGLFLSYPPEDVRGFIAHGSNRSVGCKLVGTWRVYGDAEAARETFEKYRRCTETYCKQWSDGVPLMRLAVAV